MRVHVVVLCPDTLHPLPSFAFREGILVLHVPHVSFGRKSLGMGGGAVTNRSVLSFLFFFFSSYFLFVLCRITIWLETYMDSHGGASIEALFLGGLSWKYFPPPVSFFLCFFRCQLCALFSWAHSQQAKNTRPTANRHKTQGPQPIGTKNSAHNQPVQKNWAHSKQAQKAYTDNGYNETLAGPFCYPQPTGTKHKAHSQHGRKTSDW